MVALLEELEKKAQELPVNEREVLASHILHSIHEQELTPLENEWLSVASKRFDALMTGEDKGLSETEFFQRFGIGK
jgi:putative addiction module component (TIGR02574 family)